MTSGEFADILRATPYNQLMNISLPRGFEREYVPDLCTIGGVAFGGGIIRNRQTGVEVSFNVGFYPDDRLDEQFIVTLVGD